MADLGEQRRHAGGRWWHKAQTAEGDGAPRPRPPGRFAAHPAAGATEGADTLELENMQDAVAEAATAAPDGGAETLEDRARRHRGAHYLTPTDLSVKRVAPRRVALIGSCLLNCWKLHTQKRGGTKFDLYIVHNAAGLPAQPPEPFDLQVIQLPLRGIIPDKSLWHLPYDDLAAHEQALERARSLLNFQLDQRMSWNKSHGLLTFVSNFMEPQRNPLGALLPRYDLRNPEYFVRMLNEELERRVRSYRNAYVLDMDRIAASIGRRYIQDDAFVTTNHNAVLTRLGPLENRIEPVAPFEEHYTLPPPRFVGDAVWNEIVSMFRVVRGADAVKIVMVDLDDTLWNGVSGEAENAAAIDVTEWHNGIVEALVYLKKRGVLLAVVSKNEESRIRALWPELFGRRISLDDFAAIRINWRPKAENIAEILSLVNLLPRNAVFVDDNPAERAAVTRAFPDIRTLGRHPYYLKRVLLWSSETQVASITAESSARTKMVQAQIVRETARTDLSREAFLTQAAPVVTVFPVTGAGDAKFPRTFELLNKTNQFNTTGKRWTAEEIGAFLADGGRILAFEVHDNFTEYGLVGVVLIRDAAIVQFVMSCRVLGYEIETAVMARAVAWLRAEGATAITGTLVETDVNFPCRELFSKSGFARGEEASWMLPAGAAPEAPAHVTVAGD